MAKRESKGLDSWITAGGILLGFLSIRAAFTALRSESKSPSTEQLQILKRIEAKLSNYPSPTEGIDYDEI